MNPTQLSDLLHRAAADVTPTETDPATLLSSLGRSSVRSRRVLAVVATAAAMIAVLVVLPLLTAGVQRTPDAAVGTVRFGGLTIAVPAGWRTSAVEIVDVCTAEPRTVYLADGWQNSSPLTDAPGTTPYRCRSEGQPWMAVVDADLPRTVNPSRLIVKDDRLLQVGLEIKPSGHTYRAFDDDTTAPQVFISGDGSDNQLLRAVTWPAGRPAPAAGGLALPAEITSAVTEDAGPMVAATDEQTLKKIRSKLAALRDPVPDDEMCVLQKPGRVGISLGDVIVVLGDATCPQAVSTGGGRVRAPAGLGKELRALIVASDRAAAKD